MKIRERNREVQEIMNKCLFVQEKVCTLFYQEVPAAANAEAEAGTTAKATGLDLNGFLENQMLGFS